MQPGDVILEVAGHPVNSVPELQERISQYRPGETVEVLCIRKGQLTPLAVELRDASGSTRIVDRSEAEWTDALGVRMVIAQARSAAGTQLPKGVEIVELRRGKFLEAGVRKGFVITKIDGREVETPADVIEIFASEDGGLLVEGHYPNGKRAYYGVSAQR